jgi:hypothetical protein
MKFSWSSTHTWISTVAAVAGIVTFVMTYAPTKLPETPLPTPLPVVVEPFFTKGEACKLGAYIDISASAKAGEIPELEADKMIAGYAEIAKRFFDDGIGLGCTIQLSALCKRTLTVYAGRDITNKDEILGAMSAFRKHSSKCITKAKEQGTDVVRAVREGLARGQAVLIAGDAKHQKGIEGDESLLHALEKLPKSHDRVVFVGTDLDIATKLIDRNFKAFSITEVEAGLNFIHAALR